MLIPTVVNIFKVFQVGKIAPSVKCLPWKTWVWSQETHLWRLRYGGPELVALTQGKWRWTDSRGSLFSQLNLSGDSLGRWGTLSPKQRWPLPSAQTPELDFHVCVCTCLYTHECAYTQTHQKEKNLYNISSSFWIRWRLSVGRLWLVEYHQGDFQGSLWSCPSMLNGVEWL